MRKRLSLQYRCKDPATRPAFPANPYKPLIF